MRKIWIVCVLSGLAAIARAAAPESQVMQTRDFASAPIRIEAPQLQANPWNDLLHEIADKGQYTPTNGVFAANYGLQSIVGNTGSFHIANYVNLWGSTDDDGKFYPDKVTLVSENWRAFDRKDSQDETALKECSPAKCRTVDQWIYSLKVDGNVSSVRHDYVIEGYDARVYDTPYIRETPEQGKAKLDSLLSLWYAFKP